MQCVCHGMVCVYHGCTGSSLDGLCLLLDAVCLPQEAQGYCTQKCYASSSGTAVQACVKHSWLPGPECYLNPLHVMQPALIYAQNSVHLVMLRAHASPLHAQSPGEVSCIMRRHAHLHAQ